MGKTTRKWKRALPWIVLLCLVLGSAMAIYTYGYEADRYRAVYSFFAQPAHTGANTEAPLEASRMLARDMDALLAAESFRSAILSKTESDGRSVVHVRGVDGTHMLELEVIGPEASTVMQLANAAGEELVKRASSELHAQNVTVLDEATLPTEPFAPDRPMKIVWTVLAAFVIGSLLGLLFGNGTEMAHATPTGCRQLSVPSIGAVVDCRHGMRAYLRKRNKKKYNGTLLSHMDRLVKESVRSVAVVLHINKRSMGIRSLTLTGMAACEGKNTLAVLLASELAAQGLRVLLVDMESRAPRIGQLLDVHGRADLFDYLSGGASLQETVMPTQVDRLYFIDNKHAGTPLCAIAASEEFASFVTAAASNFDFLMLNAGPAGLCADASMIGALTDATVLTAPDGRYTAEEINDVAAGLARTVKHLSGVVMTGVSRRHMSAFAEYDDEEASPLEAC